MKSGNSHLNQLGLPTVREGGILLLVPVTTQTFLLRSEKAREYKPTNHSINWLPLDCVLSVERVHTEVAERGAEELFLGRVLQQSIL